MAVRISLLLLCIIGFARVCSGQAILKQKVDFDAVDMRFEDVMLSLAEEGGFTFSYNPDMLPVDSLINLHVENTSVKVVLTTLLGREMELRQRGSHLVILKTRYTENYAPAKSKNKTNTISGYVRDQRTGYSIVGATVYDVNSLNSAVTDESGYYQIEVPIKEPVIGVSIAAYNVEDTTLVIRNTTRKLDIPVRKTLGAENIQDSTEQLESLKLVQLVAADEGMIRARGQGLDLYRTAQISFVPFVGTNMQMSGMITNKFSFNVLAGYNGATDGVEFGGLVNINRMYVRGVQIAGLANNVGQETQGVQLAGLFNTNLGVVRGVQIAGVNNLVLDSLKGVQLSGVNNVIEGRTDGVQIAGINNLALKNVDGVQLAGISNIAFKDVNFFQAAGVVNFGRDIRGFQLAGVLNTSYGRVSGFQAAGVMNIARSVRSFQLAAVGNVAADTAYGAQMSAVFNFARKSQGFQLALFNFGDSTSGVSIGLINLFLRGYNSLEITSNDVLPMNAQLRLGGYKFYNIFGIGTQGFETGNVWGYTYGFGTSFRMGRRRNLIHLDLTLTDLQDDDTWFEELNGLARLELLFAFSLSRRFVIFGGPSFNNLFYETENLESDPFLEDIPPYTLYETSYDNWQIKGWVGFNAGLRMHLYF